MHARVLALAAFLASSAAAAQTDRKGFSFALGAGSGTFEFMRDDLSARSIVSQSWMLRIGYAHSQHVALGFEIDHWSDGAPFKPSFTWYNAVVLGYPFARGPIAGLYAKALLGIHRHSNRVFDTSERGYGAGLGYELRVVRNVSLAAYADYIVAAKSDVKSHTTLANGEVMRINTYTGGNMVVYGLGLRLR